ncbi:hypothetical protein [Pseudomonas viridiflava]|uniref:hypothetical protein n=1 Tax=Pseudomonas viridiflava TaxID=33069 RepID=UPI001FD4E182|nr:hypothetical protein [Pseudomonas viridiflava]
MIRRGAIRFGTGRERIKAADRRGKYALKTSPEELLKQVFDAGKLRGELDDIITAVKGSSTFQQLPSQAKGGIVEALIMSRDNLPAIVGIVEKRLVKWKGMQRNSSAASSGSSHPKRVEKPATKDATVAAQGKDNPSAGHSNQSVNSKLGIQTSDILNEGLGVCGEHIADYICAENFGWGEQWDGHDKGLEGKWLGGNPGSSKLGKLSKGGNPKSRYVLYKLTDGANGVGIDSIWRATPKNNNNKKFAIVEAKASKREDAPKFLQVEGAKPKVASKLGLSGRDDPSDLLEPIFDGAESQGGASRKKAGVGKLGGKSGGKSGGGKPDSVLNKGDEKKAPKKKKYFVQMSRAWINDKLPIAIKDIILREEIMRSYSRHLFFTPLYHPSFSPKKHAEAQLGSGEEASHREHAAFHYDEEEVRVAVNKRFTSLRRKFGELAVLKEEDKLV